MAPDRISHSTQHGPSIWVLKREKKGGKLGKKTYFLCQLLTASTCLASAQQRLLEELEDEKKDLHQIK